MSTLSKNERDGLEDVFSSIHSNRDRYEKIKELSALIISKKNDFSIRKLLKVAKYGTLENRFSNFFSFIDQKKKNLSK